MGTGADSFTLKCESIEHLESLIDKLTPFGNFHFDHSLDTGGTYPDAPHCWRTQKVSSACYESLTSASISSKAYQKTLHIILHCA